MGWIGDLRRQSQGVQSGASGGGWLGNLFGMNKGKNDGQVLSMDDFLKDYNNRMAFDESVKQDALGMTDAALQTNPNFTAKKYIGATIPGQPSTQGNNYQQWINQLTGIGSWFV